MIKGLSLTTFVMGLWLALAPFALMYNDTTAALLGDIIVGLLITVFVFYRAYGAEIEGRKGMSEVSCLWGFGRWSRRLHGAMVE